MSYDFEIIHRAGAPNIAEFISRHPVTSTDSSLDDVETESFIAFISDHAVPKAMIKEEIITETKGDERLVILVQSISGT
jgi:hypothetical protein